MWNKTITVMTQEGSKIYQIEVSKRQYRIAYLAQDGNPQRIGEARVQDDAMLIIRDHATTHFGGVRQVNIS